jgi:single-strand DNA-binding protein
MYRSAANPAAQPNSSLKAPSAPFLSAERRNGACERPSFSGSCAAAERLRLWRTSGIETWWSDCGPVGALRLVSRPLLGVTLGAFPAPCGTRSSASRSAPLGGLGSSRNKFANRRHRTPRKPLPGPAEKADLRHLGAGPTRQASPGVTRAGYGKFNETEITIMYQNKVTLIGFLGNDAEVRTNDNRSFITLSLATKSSYKKDGQYISHTEWHRCVVFGKLSEFARALKKGAHVQVEGELRSREYDSKKTGGKQTIWEIRVNSILKLDRAEKSGPEEQDADDRTQEEAAA